MNKIRSRVARAGSLVLAVGGAAAALALLPSAALAVTPPLSITVTTSSSITNGTTTTYVGNVGVTYGITYTIKANTSGATFTNVGFTDALPAFVTLDDEVGETAKNCGTPFTPSNQPGQDSVTESGLTVANGTSCTITLEFVGTTPEVGAGDTISGATYTYAPGGGSATTYTQSANPGNFSITPVLLTIAADPTISITGVSNGATYAPGQNVVLSFGATAAANDAIVSGGVYATDDQGNTLSSGTAVNTLVPGTHQVQVWVQTQDGYVGSQTLSYTVSSPSLTGVKTSKTGQVSFGVKFLAAGSLTAEVLDGKTVVGTLKKPANVKAGANVAATISPTAAGKKLLLKHPKGVRVTLSVLYTASGWSYVGTQPTIQKTNILLKYPQKKKAKAKRTTKGKGKTQTKGKGKSKAEFSV